MGNAKSRALTTEPTKKPDKGDKPPKYGEFDDKKLICETTQTQPTIKDIKLKKEQIKFKKRVQAATSYKLVDSYVERIIKSNNISSLIVSPYDPYILKLARDSCNNGDIDVDRIINIDCIKQYINHIVDKSLKIDTYMTHNICMPIVNDFIKETCPLQYKIISLWCLIISAKTIYNNMWAKNGKLRKIFGNNRTDFSLSFVAVNSIDLSKDKKCHTAYNNYDNMEYFNSDMQIISIPQRIIFSIDNFDLPDYRYVCDTITEYSNAVGLIFFISSHDIKNHIKKKNCLIKVNEALM